MTRELTIATLLLVTLAWPAAASDFFPTTPGASWTLTGAGDAGTWTWYLGAEQLWHEDFCQPRTEVLDGDLAGTSFWSCDPEGRILLHGLVHAPGGAGEWYFDPPVVYLDDALQAGEQTSSTTVVYEVTASGDQYYGEKTVVLECTAREAVSTPLGTFPAISVTVDWPDSPAGAPWRYASGGELSYGLAIGPLRLRIAGGGGPEWLLSEVDGVVVTASPGTLATPAPLALRAGPNPFNPATTLRFSLPAADRVRLEIFDLAGRRVGVLRDGVLPAGEHAVAWQPRDLGSGVYLARVSTSTRTDTARLVLVE